MLPLQLSSMEWYPIMKSTFKHLSLYALAVSLTYKAKAAFGIHGVKWAEIIIAIGSFAALTSTMLVLLLAQSRMIYALSRDGLLPNFLSRMWNGKPYLAITVSGIFCLILAFFLNIEKLAELTSAGALFAFTMVSISVLTVRCDDAGVEHKHVYYGLSGLIIVTAGLGIAVCTDTKKNSWNLNFFLGRLCCSLLCVGAFSPRSMHSLRLSLLVLPSLHTSEHS